jgi:hypothetical protein
MARCIVGMNKHHWHVRPHAYLDADADSDADAYSDAGTAGPSPDSSCGVTIVEAMSTELSEESMGGR